MKLPTVYLRFQTPVIIRFNRKYDFLKEVEGLLEDNKVLNALRIYKIYTGLGLREAKMDFDALSVQLNRHTPKGRKKVINGLRSNIIENDIKVKTKEEFDNYLVETRH